MIKLKDYQKEAVENLHQKIEKSLKSPESEVVVFQAPTGSGKTVMVSALLKEFVRNRQDNNKFSFVWVSVRMLHEQSKEKLESYYEDDGNLRCSYFEDLEDRKIDENEILFINWHSINKKDINIFIKDNEKDNNLSNIIKNTKEDGRFIILIIDESHHTAGAEKSKELIEIIGPKITLEVSATPHLTEKVSEIEKVRLSDVKAEEMIKSEISVNPEFLNIKIGLKSSDEIVIEQALKKREELLKMYKREGSKINPLMLIQLPDNKSNLVSKKEGVIKLLNKKGITEKNGKLAIWLSEDKSDTLPNIEKNDNEVEVLIFKQAIALGWDCPRASILVIFRESKSFTFTIQTIGRIMRMPELKYYSKEPELNVGYVFTNLPNIEITEDYAKDYITIYESKRDSKLYNNISLPSIYLRRQRERTRLSGEFVKIFTKITEANNFKKQINLKPSKIINPIIAEGKIIDIDKSGEIEHKGMLKVSLDEKELQDKFDRFIVQNCTPYSPADSSDRMKTAIYQFFNKEFKFDKYDSKVQRMVLGKENIQLFVNILNLAKEKYKKEVVEKLSEKRELQAISNWEVPIFITYNSRYKKEEQPISVMKPFYVATQSEPERLFIELLNNSKKIKWWYKNGEAEIKYFAILRSDDRAFYPDFIIQFKNGTIGIFETKSGFTAGEDAKERAESLQRYIKKQNKSGKKIIGGIAIYVNGTWRYNDNDKYKYDPNNLSEWKILSL
ncbi:MAG: DEAD/DEAH box helicase family protein [Patescibacteria group bacterium]|nr:DEAD/DEAH box helicase family protein [Patescibacteria group bacterium]MDD4304020.1 DEAD/DEAH box helicase family protein [Patescibacteria group bacterium]MDD4694897.1 DEAD/DEAH box helicase family protein [Patescibacteria group bacterium]